MEEKLNKPEPKKIKMPPLVDRSKEYDILGWHDANLEETDENNSKNDSQSIQELESL
jgi:hypothetical protein